MALPTNLSTVRVTGTFVTYDGQGVQGSVSFTPSLPASNPLLDATEPTVIVPSRVTAGLDASGHFEIDLPATDDPDVVPDGFTYHVVEDFGSLGKREYDIDLPLANASVDLCTKGHTTAQTPQEPFVASVNAQTGVVVIGLPNLVDVDPGLAPANGQVLTWDDTNGQWTADIPTTGGEIAVATVNGVDPDAAGNVQLTASDVGADVAGAASTAVATHVADPDPHGAKAYADGLAPNYDAAGSAAAAQAAAIAHADALTAADVGALPDTYAPTVADIPDLPASKVTSGTFDPALIPALSYDASGAAAAAQTAAEAYTDGKVPVTIYVQSTEPATPATNALWFW